MCTTTSVCALLRVSLHARQNHSGIKVWLGAQEQRGRIEEAAVRRGGLRASSASKRLKFGSNFGRCWFYCFYAIMKRCTIIVCTQIQHQVSPNAPTIWIACMCGCFQEPIELQNARLWCIKWVSNPISLDSPKSWTNQPFKCFELHVYDFPKACGHFPLSDRLLGIISGQFRARNRHVIDCSARTVRNQA